MQAQPPILPYRSPDPETYQQRQERLARRYGYTQLGECRSEGLKLLATLFALGVLAVFAFWLLYTLVTTSNFKPLTPDDRPYHHSP